MRPSTIWFVLATAWALDTLLALFRHNWQQVALTALFATAFLAIALFYKRREARQFAGKRPKIKLSKEASEGPVKKS
jgi:hypothetical protein